MSESVEICRVCGGKHCAEQQASLAAALERENEWQDEAKHLEKTLNDVRNHEQQLVEALEFYSHVGDYHNKVNQANAQRREREGGTP